MSYYCKSLNRAPHHKSAKMQKKREKLSILPELYLIDLKFKDFEDFTDTVRNWNLEFRQLDRGQFQGDLFQAGIGAVHFGYTELNRHLDQYGGCPKGMRTLVVPAAADQSFRSRGQEITGNKIAIFPKSGELDGVSTSGFKVFTISIPEELLITASQGREESYLKILMNGVEVVEVTDNAMFLLRDYLGHLHQELSSDPSLLHMPGFSIELGSELPQRLLTALASSQDVTTSIPSRRRDQALKKSLAYIEEFNNKPLQVIDLCKATEVSVRTLRYAFVEHFGISPKAYLLRYRLNKVRNTLRSANPSITKIGDIASQWGFWHMGQFAADYRNLFGELPSTTREGSFETKHA
jgi:AraC family transcriptional regulator, ethanolamine operon transcriptional activator